MGQIALMPDMTTDDDELNETAGTNPEESEKQVNGVHVHVVDDLPGEQMSKAHRNVHVWKI